MNGMALGFYEESRNGLRIIGHGGDTQYFHSNLHLIPEVNITATDDGGLEADALNGANGRPMRFKEVAPMMYESPARDRVQFITNSRGTLTAITDFPVFVFERVSRPQDHKLVNIGVLVGSFVIMLIVLVMWPVGALVRRRYGRPLALPRMDRNLRILARVVLAWDVVALVLFVVVATRAAATLGGLNSSLTTPLRAIQIMFFLGLLGIVAVALSTARAWSSAGRGWPARLAETSALTATLAFAWILFNWNLLRLDLHF